MKEVETLLHARWVIPVIPRNAVYENYSIAIDQGKILAILPTTSAKNHYESENTLLLNNHVLLPGLVNAHTHSAMVLFRGLADDLALMEWLEKTIWPAERAFVNPEFVRDGLKLAMAEMLSSGTTCFNDHYFLPEVTANTIAEVGMRARVGLVVMSVPTPWAQNAQEYLDQAEHCLSHNTLSPQVYFSLAPHAPYTTDDKTLLKVNELSSKFKLPIHMHVHETAHEIQQSLNDYGKRPLQRLAELGLLSPLMQTVHMTQINDDDITLLQNSGTHVIHCPESNLKLVSGYCPVHQLRTAGVNLALGTDSAASNNNLDLISEMRTAALLGKTVANDATATSATDILEMATLGGAKALALDHEIGSLEPGKAADLIAVDLNHLNTQPVYNPISHLVYACHSTQVTDVWVAGQHLLKQKKFQTLNRNDILAATTAWQTRIMKLNNSAPSFIASETQQ